MTHTIQTPQAVLQFWFYDAHQAFWFAKSETFDETIRRLFGATWQAAIQAECAFWRDTAHGRLAEIIVLDQFSRNLCRNQPTAFAQDGMAVILAQELLRQAEFVDFTPYEKHFALLPFMHSESPAIHVQAVDLFKKHAPHALDFEYQHKAIIDRFGRYPHRNDILGRKSTAEELAFLTQPYSSF